MLLVGATGLLGPYLWKKFSPACDVLVYGNTRGERCADFTDSEQVRRVLEQERPDIVINCAAYTDVEGCENNPQKAWDMNAGIVQNIAAGLHPEALLVHISTDQVYPDTPGPHAEDAVAPVNVYGKTKLQGEAEALKHPRTLVLRTNIFGPSLSTHRVSISDFFITAFKNGTPVTLFTDAVFSPLHMATLADVCEDMIQAGHTGIFNAASGTSLSKADFALEIARLHTLDTSNVSLGKAAALAQRTPRARDLSMDTAKIASVLSFPLPTLNTEIKKLCHHFPS